MRKQSLFTWAISILSLIILIVLITINRQQTFNYYPSYNSPKKPFSVLMARGDNLSLESHVDLDQLLDFPLSEEDMLHLFTSPSVMYVDASSLYLRLGPSTSYDIVATLFQNDEITVGELITREQFNYDTDQTEWVAVQYGDVYGFVNPSYLSDEPHSLTINSELDDVDNLEDDETNHTTTETNTTHTSSTTPSNNNVTTSEPKITTKLETITKNVSYDVIKQENDDLIEGTSKVVVKGKNGVRTITYEITFKDNVEISKKEISNESTHVDEVIHIGTKPADNSPSETEEETSE
ncbi:hypothetical protein GCM10012290_07660 [Halolactibacillus alkaliphilus]|uniref:G5 domain-containing protein n=1 Tax=Halolactibacillus alkaliphilus TaxID=442899 RepID=A0A511WZG2_9BACI|nr:G5 domain-containing protein [Halolactibacillus alkaliphilus]GEN56080.1 hypothetical protein HAL01_05440 [Halolactibacillus alkaliphilus]GGN67309.1 hypothetical protein GCM10012290_07660 [Halolactibacillus alkaliphilus]SFO71137.1 G5 domain-containing protein [Halolactibacillus alkaliphilus]